MSPVGITTAVESPGIGIGNTSGIENSIKEVGSDLGTPVSDEYAPIGNEFNGKIRWVQITVDEDSSDHLVHPDDRLRVIMARQ